MAYIDKLRQSWDQLGEDNALWAVLSDKKSWNEDEFFETGRVEIDRVLDVLKRHKVKVKKGTALDFGCGVGRLSQALGRHFTKVVGVDIAESMLKRAKQYNKGSKNQSKVTFKHITSGDLADLKDGKFDFVFTDIVLQHMRNEQAKKYIREFYRVLSKDGVLVFQLPSKPAYTWKGALIKVLPEKTLISLRKGMEMNPIDKESVVAYLEGLGFEIITIERDVNHKHWHAYFYYVRKVGIK